MPANNAVDYEARMRLIEYRQDVIEEKLDKMNDKLDTLIQQPAKDAVKFKWIIIGCLVTSILSLTTLGASTWVKVQSVNTNIESIKQGD